MTTALVIETIGIGAACVVPILADLNRTHATNPLWTPHARMHVVWQSVTYLLLCAVALFELWFAGGPTDMRATRAAAIGASVLAGFFIAVVARPLYGGRLADENGYRPVRTTVGNRQLSIDLNLATFSVAAVLLITGWTLVATS